MGLTYSSMKRIARDAHLFHDKDIITLGTLYPFLNNHEQTKILKLFPDIEFENEHFAESLFIKCLGARSIRSIDVDSYQDSDLIHNLNLPTPDSFKSLCDIVIDAGTLEHVSNTPAFFGNIFSILKNEGIYYFGTVTNNWIDHGFFQISPTFFLDLVDENKLQMIEFELHLNDKSYSIQNESFFYKSILFNERKKTTISGCIIKTHDQELNFDFIQSKYKILFNKNHADVIDGKIFKTYAKVVVIYVLHKICYSHLLPINLRLYLAKVSMRVRY